MAVLAVAIGGWSLVSTSVSGDEDSDPTLLPKPFSAPDGTWTEIEFSGDGAFTSTVDSGEGLIAAGSGRRVDATPFVWTSADGSEWSQASGPWLPGDLIAAVVKGPAGYLAGGYWIDQSFRGTITDAEPRVWSSSDGASWELARVEGLPEGGVITDVVAATEAVVAIGWEGPAALEPLRAPITEMVPRVWASGDGTAWTDITPEGNATWFTDVTATPSGFAVGGADDEGASVWVYTRGSWTSLRAPDSDGTAVTALTWRDGELLALTRNAADPEGLVYVWTVREDGTWAPTLTGIERPGMGGWVGTVDGDLFAASAFSRSVISMGPELYASRSGTEWVGVEVTSGLTPWPPPRIMAVIEFRSELYAFGSRGPSPAAWRLDEQTGTSD